MFKKNRRHMQIPLTSHVDEMPPKLRKRLENSWACVFYRDFFCRMDETPFSVLYADIPSRPNIPINVLVGLEFPNQAMAGPTKSCTTTFVTTHRCATLWVIAN